MDVRDTLASVYRTAADREITFLAAAFAYYAFVSLVPLVLLAFVVGSLLGGEHVAQRMILFAGDLLPPAGGELLTQALTTEAGRAEATVAALLVSGWGALRVVRGLSLAFDRVYDAPAEGSFLGHVRDGVVVIAGVAAAIGLMFAIGIGLRVVAGTLPVVGLLGWVVLLVGLTAVFLPIYYVLPPVDVAFAEIVPGAAFAAIGWTALQAGFQLYAANAVRYQAYGVVGAVILFVTWLYFAGVIIMLGGVLNVVRARPELAA